MPLNELPEEPAIPDFPSKEAAIEWMEGEVDDPCTDNYRFCFNDDPDACYNYEMKVNRGCCGFFDRDITIAGRPAMIGCNYGH